MPFIQAMLVVSVSRFLAMVAEVGLADDVRMCEARLVESEVLTRF